jgi:hypothetical protein
MSPKILLRVRPGATVQLVGMGVAVAFGKHKSPPLHTVFVITRKICHGNQCAMAAGGWGSKMPSCIPRTKLLGINSSMCQDTPFGAIKY